MAENLRSWYQPPPQVAAKPRRYKSKYNPKDAPGYSTFTPNPPSEVNAKSLIPRKPKIPKFTGKEASNAASPVVQSKTTRDFIKSNAVENILSKPPRIGDKDIRYVSKAGYGQAPKYLDQVKRTVELEKQLIEEFMLDAKRPNDSYEDSRPTQDLPEADRLAMILQIKRKWGTVQRQCQNIISTDSSNKRRFKEQLESRLSQFEADIKLLSRGPIKVELEQ
jgi:hypothetical protein